jgi:hypothetical protein
MTPSYLRQSLPIFPRQFELFLNLIDFTINDGF